MQPTGDLVRQLFSSVKPNRIDLFSCGHVIPRENLIPLCVARLVLGREAIIEALTYSVIGELEGWGRTAGVEG